MSGGKKDKHRVLIVEDNALASKLLAYQLSLLGLSHEICSDGREALASLRSERFDLVLMDCFMPHMDGFEATALIRADTDPDIRSIVIVGVTMPGLYHDEERCLSAGMDAYLAKPVSISDLHRCLLKWLPDSPLNRPRAPGFAPLDKPTLLP